MLFMDPTLLLIWKVKEPPELQIVFVMVSHLGKTDNRVKNHRKYFAIPVANFFFENDEIQSMRMSNLYRFIKFSLH